jgi:shikimate 5-dehydrogenase
VLAFELWTGKKPPIEIMREALTDIICKPGISNKNS